ncbi:hypothetical protein TMES_08705 [Thalassospira mesophila]|uniref:Peptidoglycan binding-like domain-containing protein n=1 Tax=Thalassospira mesophila TaxID=1293891 RepID=A0A1Y2L2A0_9PROT|nr:hypothetical protein TMES_08705 [Thalassospira mesophila]
MPCGAVLMLVVLVFLATGAAWAAPNPHQVLYEYDQRPLAVGKFSIVSVFQERLFAAAAKCQRSSSAQYGSPDGAIGANTQKAIKDYRPCNRAAAAARQDPTDRGAVTIGLWQSLMPEIMPYPDAIERANQLTFALEGTDFDRVEFNFCQSRNPATGKRFIEGDRDCYSNDKASYLTWGPRGATAGHGAEIQQIIVLAEKAHPGLLQTVFGPEADTMRRVVLGDDDSVETILCAAWANTRRRSDLRQRFARYGALPEVQEAYRMVYEAANADGGKVQRFFRIYQALKPIIHRDPTEIDVAFFIDRATHGGAPPGDLAPLIAKMQYFVSRTRIVPSAGQMRRQLGAWLPSAHKYNDRLARDAIFLIDDPKVDLSDAHRRIWQKRSGLRASSFGLSDDRFVPAYPVMPVTGYEAIKRFATARPAEKNACPAIARKPRSP